MSRFNPNHDVEPVLAAAHRWIERCLIDEGSLFSDEALWTQPNTDDLRRAFTDHPDESGADFYEKLEGQMARATAPACRLMAEMLWALMLFQTKITPATKREGVRRVWEWSGSPLDPSHEWLNDACLVGIGGTGVAYNTARWREINYLIGLASDLQRRSPEERAGIFADRDRFEAWLASAPQNGYRQFRNIFRYFAFPDRNERITQSADRRKILIALTGGSPAEFADLQDKALDDALFDLRRKLQVELGTDRIDFYAPPVVERWRDPPAKSNAVKPGRAAAFARGYAELRKRFLAQFPGFSSFRTSAPYMEQERAYKAELIEQFALTLEPAIASGDVQASGAAAMALLTRPLKANGNRPQNIIGWRQVQPFRSLAPTQQAIFGRALADLLDESADMDDRIGAFVTAVSKIVGQDAFPPATQRLLTSFFLTLKDPQRHLFLKTTETQHALAMLDDSFQWTPGRLSGADLERAEQLARNVYAALQDEGWEPRDLVDVQGFLWVAIAYGETRVMEPGAQPPYMAKPSENPGDRAPLNQILFGPPGTGKTFHAIDRAIEILDPDVFAVTMGRPDSRATRKQRFDELTSEGRIQFVTFHQSFSYEDFVEGLRAEVDEETGALRYAIVDGVFKRLCDAARRHVVPEAEDARTPPLVLIIDEINRGNVSRIFGELITLIEPSKRADTEEALEVVLPYSKERFSVPGNVHLIGTMNTADRSLAGLDIALRRRFQFVEMPARPDLLANLDIDGIDIEAMLAAMNRRIEVLLDRDHHIGHAYFMALRDERTLPRLATVFRNQIVPLLQEYFFEDWQRIQWVLNDQHKTDGHRFIVPSADDVVALFGGTSDIPVQTRLWRIDEEAFERRDSYLGIVAV